MGLSFFAGFGLGSIGIFIAMKMVQKQAFIKLKKNFSIQQEAYEEQFQLQEENYSLEVANCDIRFRQKIEELEKKLHDQIQEKIEFMTKFEQERELNLANQKKLRENNRDIDEILESLEQSQQKILREKDRDIEELKLKIQEYAVHLEEQKTELFILKSQQSQHNESQDFSTIGDRPTSRSAASLNIEQIQELIAVLLPEITLLRDSMEILAANPENLVSLIKGLKDILEGQAYSAKKVRATDNKWTECRVPHVNLMRFYYQKSKKSGYQVLISPKKNQKSQDQDYEWLKSHSSF